MEDYKVTLTDGTPVSPEELMLMSGGSVSVEIEETSVKAKVGTRPTHLGDIQGTSADDKGLCITLEVSVVFTVGSEDSDGHLEITVTGSFVEEVGVDFGVNADAVWEWAFIIPYISDIRVAAHVDTMNYTAVSFNATMITKENEDEGDDDGDIVGKAMDISDEIKEWLEFMSEGGEQSDDFQDQLLERYSKMLSAESDWIRIVEYNIVDVKQSVPFGIPLINFHFTVAFVVDLDASISVGFDFEYIEGKRHVFTVAVKDRNVYSDTIDLQEKAYQFCFYSMGRIGLKAGVEMNFAVSVISKKLGSVGFTAGAGAYTNLYGYFFYQLKYTASQGKSQQYCGALLVQVGIYLELALEAQALGGRYSAKANLLDKEWQLLEAGRRDNVLDFVTEQEDVPEMVMKQFVRLIQLPDDFFEMAYMDLISGEAKTAVYNDWNDPEKSGDFRNGDNFIITMTNDKFTYDAKTNTICVHPDEEDLKLTGEMVITWKKQPMSFSSKAITLTIPLYWDNLRDGYMIVPYTNGGSYVPMIIKNFEARVTKPADPEKLGYTFTGWYSDADFTTPYTFPELMPATDTSIYAKWEARTDIPYTVEHYTENFRSGEYELAETETFKGTTDTYVTPEVKTYVGHVSPAQAQLKVEADGSATLRYYYRLERHNVTFDAGRIDGVEVTDESDITYNLKYGASITAPQMAMKGYTFAGWSTDGIHATGVATVVGTEDLTYTALWEKEKDTRYRIEYYVQQADGRYTLQHMIQDVTETGKVFTEAYLRSLVLDGTRTADEMFLLADAIVFESMTVGGIKCEEAAVDGDGKTVIKINYGRQKHTLTFDFAHSGAEDIVKDMFYGAEVIAPQNVTRTGYAFMGWSADGSTAVDVVNVMPVTSLTYQALWKANTYTVHFDKDSEAAEGTMADMAFTYDETQALTANGFIRTYYDFAGWAIQSAGTVKYADGDTVTNLTAAPEGVVTLYAVWTPAEYTITYETKGGTHNNPATYDVETDTIILTNAVRAGYTFDGWYTDAECTQAVTQIARGSGGHVTLHAKWIPNEGTAYTVKHYQQQLDGTYALVDTDELTGTTEAMVTPDRKDYTGFTAPAAQTQAILGDGSLVIEYYYTRNTYTITLKVDGGEMDLDPPAITAQYGAAITLPNPTRAGYAFTGWFDAEGVLYTQTTMGAADLTLIAHWEAGKIGYTVNYYLQNVDGSDSYTLAKTVPGTADMDTTVTPEVTAYEGFTAPESVTLTITAVQADNVVNYYYTRNQYTLTWDLGIGSADGQDHTAPGKIYYGAAITAPVPVKTGYTFAWDVTPATTMPAADQTYTAIWTANVYTISFNTNGGTVAGDSAAVADRQVAFDTAYGTLAEMEKDGYTFEGWYDGETKIEAATILSKDSDHTLTAKFALITYTITYHGVTAEEHSNPGTYNTEQTVVLAEPKRTGYTFNGWYDNAEYTGDAITRIDRGAIGDKGYYAKWTENTYAVTFHANNGTTTEDIRGILYTGVLGENTYEYTGYHFVGWSDGVNTYSPATSLTQLVTDSTTALHLTAVWETQKYTITYENVVSKEHENPGEYTIEDGIVLDAPERSGYTFHGWYDNAELSGDAITTITAGSIGAKIFYAKWVENTYTVVLNANDGTDRYDTYAGLRYEGDWVTTTPIRSGYTFLGWALTPDGEVVCGANAKLPAFVQVKDENGATVALYAKWKATEYTITYNLGSHAASTTHSNPTSYTVENGADIVLTDLTAESGFQFGGWYTDAQFSGEKVTTIELQAKKDYELYAKWEHGGTFSVTYTSISNRKATFTVTRTIPEGAVGTTANQNVFVRTQNGTAYGTTADSSGQDKYHFIHSYAVLAFGPNDMAKTFTVTEKDDYLENYVTASYQIGGKARNYQVEIYKVENNAGGLNGTIGTGSVTRTMPVSSYKLTTDMYRWFSSTIESSEMEISYWFDKTFTKKPADIYNGSATAAEKAYRDIVSDKYGYRITMDMNIKLTKPNIELYTVPSDGGNDILRGDYNMKYDWSTFDKSYGSLSLPTMGTGVQGDIVIADVKETYSMYNEGGYKYAVIVGTNSVKIVLKHQMNSDSSYQVKNLQMHVKMHDKNKPALQYAAPMATTAYQKGDTAYITIIYSEPINTISGTPTLSLSSKLSPYFENAAYVDNGTGTNALVFKVTAKKDITADEIQNVINTYLAFPVSGVGGDFSSNIGTVSATVKDILGN